ncbi:MAG TPA: YafY family protein [Defluviitaleaceae bacterium]|nr:YafY family protein [Defluviitaleaceae bacterium]HQD50634.1 YafY family protein [Defluviitaleaceae bacterium]
MGSIANTIKLYLILQSKGKVKIKELAEELEVDERTIRRYKDELEQANIYIDSEPGRYGGYYLYNDNYLMGLTLSQEEYLALMMINEELSRSNHVVSRDYNSAIEKISVVYNVHHHNATGTNFSNYTVKKSKSNVNISEERKKLIDIHAAALTRNKVKIKYYSLSSGLSERIVHPYATIQYKGDLYFAGYCEKRQEIRDFKLCRIREYTVLDSKFPKNDNFNLEEYMKNCIGIIKDEKIDLKIQIFFPMAQIVKEKIFVDNQKITEYKDEGYIIYEATMEGLEEIKSWILSMGSYAKVLEPKFLQDEIKDEIKKIINIY